VDPVEAELAVAVIDQQRLIADRVYCLHNVQLTKTRCVTRDI
jgi:hypothetical protein